MFDLRLTIYSGSWKQLSNPQAISAFATMYHMSSVHLIYFFSSETAAKS